MTRLQRCVLLAVVLNAAYCVSQIAVLRAQDLFQLDRRVTEIDKDLSGRIRVLESDMIEVKWLTRVVTGGVLGHMVIAALKGAQKGEKGDTGERGPRGFRS